MIFNAYSIHTIILEFTLIKLKTICAAAVLTAILCIGTKNFVRAETPPAVPVTTVEAETLIETPVIKTNAQDMGGAESKAVTDMPDKVIDESANIPIKKEIDLNVPPPPEKPIPEIGDSLTVLELFSTQACTFCPKADALMKQLIKKKNLIALSCHIDYFDVAEGSLSQPICSTRQIAYEGALNAGPKYTPQMVINGRYDAIGYLVSELDDAFLQAQKTTLEKIKVKKIKNKNFELTLPDLALAEYKIWLVVFDNPRTIMVADGANRGKEMTYYNIVSKAGFLGNWNGNGKPLKFDAKMDDMSKGFAVLVHDAKTQHILAAGQYLK